MDGRIRLHGKPRLDLCTLFYKLPRGSEILLGVLGRQRVANGRRHHCYLHVSIIAAVAPTTAGAESGVFLLVVELHRGAG